MTAIPITLLSLLALWMLTRLRLRGSHSVPLPALLYTHVFPLLGPPLHRFAVALRSLRSMPPHSQGGGLRLGGKEVHAHAHDVVVHTIPYLSDNYAYLIEHVPTKTAVVVDAGDADAVATAVHELKLTLTTVLTTHWHPDHAGGNHALADKFPSVKFIAPAGERSKLTLPPHDSTWVDDGTLLTLTLNNDDVRVRVDAVPGHTHGSVAFTLLAPSPSNEPLAIFTGDFLFCGGMGKFFEGGAADMLSSVERVLRPLPPTTLVFPGHEYTLSNLEFALGVDPTHAPTRARFDHLKSLRNATNPPTATVPSTLHDEFQTNIFLRACAPSTNPELAQILTTLTTKHRVPITTGSDTHTYPLATIDDATSPTQLLRAVRALKDAGLAKLGLAPPTSL